MAANVKSKDRDNVLHLGVNILPDVKEMFKKAQEEEEAMREDVDYP
jgi:hypothetical protein